LVTGRRVAVVGGTGGIGGAIVGELLRGGASVLASGRSSERLRDLADSGASTITLDLADPRAPDRLADAVRDRFAGALDALVIAAGSLGPIGPTRDLDPDRLAAALAQGPVASVALVRACAPLLDTGDSPSVVLYSGGGATDAFPRYTAYALAKVATVRLVENLAAEEPGWRVNAVAPGFVATGIHDGTLAAGAAAGSHYGVTTERLARAESPTHAAELTAFLISRESAGISGRLISAIWDPWRDASFRELLRSDPSLGRLRRIDGQHFAAVGETA
jgi:3-oxoacyl-[acyl-carrier protein] reductase